MVRRRKIFGSNEYVESRTYYNKKDAQRDARYARRVSPNKEGRYARVIKTGKGQYTLFERKMPAKVQYRVLKKMGYRY